MIDAEKEEAAKKQAEEEAAKKKAEEEEEAKKKAEEEKAAKEAEEEEAAKKAEEEDAAKKAEEKEAAKKSNKMSIEDLRCVKDQVGSTLRELYMLDPGTKTNAELDELTEQSLELETQYRVLCQALAISMVSVARGATILCYTMV